MSSVLLTQEEINELECLCNDPNLELGMMMRPKHMECLKPKIATNSMMVIISFDTNTAARKWNYFHEKRIRLGGHIATIALGVLAGVISKNYTMGVAASAMLSSSIGITKDEIQAQVWYPKVYKGWLLTRYTNFRYEQFPHQNLCFDFSDKIQDENGVEQERRKYGPYHCNVGGANGVPEKLVRELISRMPKFQTYIFS